MLPEQSVRIERIILKNDMHLRLVTAVQESLVVLVDLVLQGGLVLLDGRVAQMLLLLGKELLYQLGKVLQHVVVEVDRRGLDNVSENSPDRVVLVLVLQRIQVRRGELHSPRDEQHNRLAYLLRVLVYEEDGRVLGRDVNAIQELVEVGPVEAGEQLEHGTLSVDKNDRMLYKVNLVSAELALLWLLLTLLILLLLLLLLLFKVEQIVQHG